MITYTNMPPNPEQHREQEVPTSYSSRMTPEQIMRAKQEDMGAKLTNYQTGETVVYKKMKEREERQKISPEEVRDISMYAGQEIAREMGNEFRGLALSPQENALLNNMLSEISVDFGSVLESMFHKALSNPEAAALLQNFDPNTMNAQMVDDMLRIFGKEVGAFIGLIEQYSRKYAVLFDKLENQNVVYAVLDVQPQGVQKGPQHTAFASGIEGSPEAEPVAGGKVNMLLREYHKNPNAPYAKIILMSKLFLAGVDYGALVGNRSEPDSQKASSNPDQAPNTIPTRVSSKEVQAATPKKAFDQILLRLVGLIQYLYLLPKLNQVKRGELTADGDGGNERVTEKGKAEIKKIGEKIDKKYKTPFEQFIENGKIKTVEDATQFKHVVDTIKTPMEKITEKKPDAHKKGLTKMFTKSKNEDDIVMFEKLKTDPFAGDFAVALDEYYVQLGEKEDAEETKIT